MANLHAPARYNATPAKDDSSPAPRLITTMVMMGHNCYFRFITDVKAIDTKVSVQGYFGWIVGVSSKPYPAAATVQHGPSL